MNTFSCMMDKCQLSSYPLIFKDYLFRSDNMNVAMTSAGTAVAGVIVAVIAAHTAWSIVAEHPSTDGLTTSGLLYFANFTSCGEPSIACCTSW